MSKLPGKAGKKGGNGKNIVAVSVKDYKNLYEKNELRVLKDYTIFLIRGEGTKSTGRRRV